jgi:hypothetical protein
MHGGRQMTLKTTLVALALTLSPGLALAQGCPHDRSLQEASISCAEGTTLDAVTGKCLPVSS